MNSINLFLDSGAFSAWNKGAEINLDEYIEFCLKYSDQIDLIANLDVIPGKPYQKLTQADIDDSAKQGWKNYQRMLRAGISKDKLIHIFHQGEDFKWLERMVKIMPYIGLSPANDKTTKEKIIWLDKCMDYVLDKDGYPIVKFHGFAVTSFRLMNRYPWYSVDSTSWVMTGGLGSIYVPRFKNNEWVYDENSWKIQVSNRSPSKKDAGKHIDTFSPMNKKVILNYIHEKGYKLGKSEFRLEDEKYQPQENEKWNGKANNGLREVETIIEQGICNDYKLRDEMNIIYFLDLEKTMPKWPWAFKINKKAGFAL